MSGFTGTFTVISSGSTTALTAFTIPSSVLSANCLGLLAIYQRANTATTPPFASNVSWGAADAFVSSTSTVFDDSGAARGRFDTFRYLNSANTTSQITLTFPSVFSTLLWRWLQISGVTTTGTKGSGAINQASSISATASGSILTAALPGAFGSANNAVIAFFGLDSTTTITRGSTSVDTFGSYFTGSVQAAGLASFYSTQNVSTITTNGSVAQYGGAIFEIVSDIQDAASTSTAFWAQAWDVRPFQALGT